MKANCDDPQLEALMGKMVVANIEWPNGQVTVGTGRLTCVRDLTAYIQLETGEHAAASAATVEEA